MNIPARTNYLNAFLQNYQLQQAIHFVLLLHFAAQKSKDTNFTAIQLSNNAGNSSDNASGTGNSGGAGNGNTGGNDDDSDNFNEDTGTGMSGSDYVGKATGNMIDDSIADTVSGGGTTGDKNSNVSGTTVGGITTDEAQLGNANMDSDTPKAGRAIKSGQPGASDAGKEPSGALGINDKSPKININEDDDSERKAVDRGTGTGAAMNNLNEKDADSGTGSAQRGNRAGVPDADTGTISGGTMTSSGIDDSGTGSEK